MLSLAWRCGEPRVHIRLFGGTNLVTLDSQCLGYSRTGSGDLPALTFGAANGESRRQPPDAAATLHACEACRLRPTSARTAASTEPRSFGRTVNCSCLSNRSAKRGGRAGRWPVARSIASGNFAGWAVAIATTGASPEHGRALGRRQCRSRCAGPPGNLSRHAGGGSRPRCRHHPGGSRGTSPRARRQTGSATCIRPVLRKSSIVSRVAVRVAVQQFEQQPLEVGADLDVHAGGQ